MLTVDEIEYWEEQKALASKNHADRTATMKRVAEAEREIARIKREKASAASVGSADVPIAPPNNERPVSGLDIHGAARWWVHQHGDQATAMARQMVEWMRQKGDTECADTWQRITVAIGTLGTPPTDCRH
jgi:hypothetical protein